MVLPQARADSDLTCSFQLAPTRLTVAVMAECENPRSPDRDGFAWTVLSALTTSVNADVEGDQLTITLARTTTESG
jgi:serine/threonine-protein kinase RsbW